MRLMTTAREARIGTRLVGDGHPVYVVAEIGINHNGDLAIARELIDAAVDSGCDAVKFQKRTPELCVPPDQRDRMRQTPWGCISYLDYRERVEFSMSQYEAIDRHCRQRGISWFASCWDEPAVGFVERFDPPCYKIQSAAVTDRPLLERIRGTGRPTIMSTGMSSMPQIREAVDLFNLERLVILHSTSAYPCPAGELNLRMIQTLRQEFPCPIGYSGHEIGIAPTLAAVALGACYVERHLTLDCSMWGSDQTASLEPKDMAEMVRQIRTLEAGLGDGVKQVYASEIPVMQRLRRVI